MTTKNVSDIPFLYESDNFLIVEKPPDLLINSDDECIKNTLHQLLLSSSSTIDKPLKHGFHFIHRLDYATSGVICLGRNKQAAGAAGRLFERRSVLKYYLALVRGHIHTEMLEVDIAIGYDVSHLDDNKRMCCEGAGCLKSRKASTRLLVLQRGLYAGQPATKVLLKPLTGRRHQLRVHCQLLGHPIVGDFTYSDPQDNEPPRMYLHAYRLKIPMKDEPIDVRTTDPFNSDNGNCFFISTEMVNDLKIQSGQPLFERLDNDLCHVVRTVNNI